MKTVAVYLHNGIADWEASFILPCLVDVGYKILTVSENKEPVRTLGGLTVLPDHKISDLNWSEINLLILPGGDSWSDPSRNKVILSLLPQIKKDNIPIAAICAATVSLARIGLLDNVKHASNFLAHIKHFAPAYKGEHLFVNQLATTDQGLITASGIGPIEFAYEILKTLNVWDEQKRLEWFAFYKSAKVPETWIP